MLANNASGRQIPNEQFEQVSISRVLADGRFFLTFAQIARRMIPAQQ